MATDYKKCHQCGGVAQININSDTAEHYTFCERCGNLESHKFKRIRRGRAKEDKVAYDKNGNPIFEDTNSFGYGCVKFESYSGIACWRYYDFPLNDADVKSFLNDLISHDKMAREMYNLDKSYATYWDGKTQSVKSIFGEIPKLFDEVFEENNENEQN